MLLAIVICFVPIVEHKARGCRILRVVLEMHLLLGNIVHLQLVLVTVTSSKGKVFALQTLVG